MQQWEPRTRPTTTQTNRFKPDLNHFSSCFNIPTTGIEVLLGKYLQIHVYTRILFSKSASNVEASNKWVHVLIIPILL